MYGYATDETDEYMPLTVVLSHNLNKKMAELRRDGTLAWLRPDSKTQVCVSLYFNYYTLSVVVTSFLLWYWIVH